MQILVNFPPHSPQYFQYYPRVFVSCQTVVLAVLIRGFRRLIITESQGRIVGITPLASAIVLQDRLLRSLLCGLAASGSKVSDILAAGIYQEFGEIVKLAVNFLYRVIN